jgi:hypothetical protein
LHFSQDTDAGRKIAHWLDKTYLRNLETMQALLAEARSEWSVNGHSTMRNLPYLNGISYASSFQGSTNTPKTEETV